MYAVQFPMDHSPDMKASRSTNDIGISSLPEEILNKIFVLSVSADLSTTSRQVLCSVNQHWRGVALAYSDLWRTVSCKVDKLFPPIPLLELWVERSHQALLEIRIKSESTKTTLKQKGYLRRALEILLPHCYRWRKLVVFVPFGQAEVFAGATLRCAVELETVEVAIDDKDNPLMDVLATAPSIKHLKWQTWRLQWGDVRLSQNFPWEKLLRISLSYQHPWAETSQIVSRCTSAKVMILYVPLLPVTTKFPIYIHLPNLRTLCIVGCERELPLIRNLSSPGLSVLSVEIEGEEGIENLAIRQLCAFITSGKHNLRMLQVQINNQWLTEEEARMLLRACREYNILSVDVHICFDPWGDFPSDESGVDYSLVTKEFQGARIGASCTRSVVFGWVDLRALDGFISEFRKIPDVDMAGVRPFYDLACLETAEDEALKMKVKRGLKLFPKS